MFLKIYKKGVGIRIFSTWKKLTYRLLFDSKSLNLYPIVFTAKLRHQIFTLILFGQYFYFGTQILPQLGYPAFSFNPIIKVTSYSWYSSHDIFVFTEGKMNTLHWILCGEIQCNVFILPSVNTKISRDEYHENELRIFASLLLLQNCTERKNYALFANQFINTLTWK